MPPPTDAGAAPETRAEPIVTKTGVPLPRPPEPPPRVAEHGVSGLLQAVKKTSWAAAMSVENAWNDLKKVGDPVEMHAQLRAQMLQEKACRGLINFRNLAVDAMPPFSYRDDTRGRSWVRPTVAQVMILGLERLRQEAPDATLTVGDLSQPGCGQLSHGTLVRYVSDDDSDHVISGPRSRANEGAATRLLNAAQWRLGSPRVIRLGEARDLGSETRRLAALDESVLIEQELLSQTRTRLGSLALKVATRRFRPLLMSNGPTPLDGLRVLMKRGKLVRSERVRDGRSEGRSTLWLQHWVAPELKRQGMVLSTRKLTRRVRASWVVELHLGRWQAKKPRSFPGLVRYFPTSTEAGDVTWHGWRQLYEAGHQTHLAGRDADLSYVTRGNRRHFAVDLEGIDLDLSWRWFEILDAVSRELGARVDRILVAPSVHRLFKRRFGKTKRRSKIWRLLRRVGGHDAHHHVRINIPRGTSRRAADFIRHLGFQDDPLFNLPPGVLKRQQSPTPPKPPR